MFACTPQSPLTAMNDQKPETGVTDSCSGTRALNQRQWPQLYIFLDIISRLQISTPGHHTGIVGMLGELCNYCRYYYIIYNIGCRYLLSLVSTLALLGIFVVNVHHTHNIQAVDIFAWSPHCIVGMLGELERRENINIPLPIGSQREYY